MVITNKTSIIAIHTQTHKRNPNITLKIIIKSQKKRTKEEKEKKKKTYKNNPKTTKWQ